jgi:hypothetical protein
MSKTLVLVPFFAHSWAAALQAQHSD